jgi:hypothetical protein
LLRGVLDEHSKSVQGIQPTRERSYNETEFYDVTPPEDLPKWAYFSDNEEGKSAIKPQKRKVIEYEEQGESALMGEIRGAIEKEKSIKRPKRQTEESTEGKETTQSGKLRRSARVKSIKGKGKEKEEEEEEEEETEDDE